jgi:outer membrane protein TolC
MHPPEQTFPLPLLSRFLPGIALALCALAATAHGAKGPATADLLTEEEKSTSGAARTEKAAVAPAKAKPAKGPVTADLLTEEEAGTEAAPEDSASEGDVARTPPTPTDPSMNVAGVEREALARHPILSEKSMEVDKAEEQVRTLDKSIILPKFEVETGIGPAPGIRQVTDSVPTTDPDIYVLQPERKFDFGEWGPFFGVQANIIQPLNIARYRAGRRAATLRVRVSEAEFKKEQLKISEEAQALYYQRLFALTMERELASSRRELDKAQRRLTDQLDEGKGDVSQTDVLQIKSGRYSLDAGWNEATLGVARTGLALRFMLDRPDTSVIALDDTVLTLRSETPPSLHDLKLAALRGHPDLSRLRNGLSAREELLKVAQGELGPDIFLFGNFKYSKAWSSDRQSGGDDPFARDPLNELTAVAGLGMRLKLNFWSGYQKYRKERLELRQLERTEVYAARGILLQLEDAYLKMLAARADVEEAQKALRAADAWLKGAAMKYDLDPGAAKDLIGPFKQSLTARRDYYKAVLEYNIALARVLTATGWTLADFGSLATASPPLSETAKEQE